MYNKILFKLLIVLFIPIQVIAYDFSYQKEDISLKLDFDNNEIKKKKKNEEKKKDESNKKEIGWGNQIRSYVLHPYKMVKDLRTQYQTSNTEAVLDGSISDFLEASLLDD